MAKRWTVLVISGWGACVMLGACIDPLLPFVESQSDDDSSSSDADTGMTSSSTSTGMTTFPGTTTTTTGDPDTSTSSTSSSSGMTTSPTLTDGPVDTSPGCENAELGAACVDPVCDCASDNCFVVGPLGGVCSECDESSDCEATTGFGCNFGNPLTGTPAVCSLTGGIGESCETADDCAGGLFCPVLIEVPGILSESTCSECQPETDDGCTGAEICTPLYDIADIGGNYYCAAPGSAPNDEGCNLNGDGSECASGECAPASLMGIPIIAVCSPCNEDTDCGGGMTCLLPEIAIEGDLLALVPGMCV